MRWSATPLLLLFSIVAACSSPQPVAPTVDWSAKLAEIQRKEAEIQRQGDVLQAKWSHCQMDALRDLAKSKIPTEEVPQKANQMCHSEREAWVDSQVGPGMTRAFVESVADGTEHCSYPIDTGYVGLLRSGASKEDIQLWALTQQTPSCAK